MHWEQPSEEVQIRIPYHQLATNGVTSLCHVRQRDQWEWRTPFEARCMCLVLKSGTPVSLFSKIYANLLSSEL